MRRNEVVYSMTGHSDTVTGLSISPNGHYLLSNSMDNTGEVHANCSRNHSLYLMVQNHIKQLVL